MSADAGEAAEQVAENPVVRWSARGGLVAYGLVHLLIGWTALQLAWPAAGGAASSDADTSGAMATLAQQPFGRLLLCSVAAGLWALALWQVTELFWGRRTGAACQRLRQRTTNGARAVVYTALGGSALSVALGWGSSSSQSKQRATTGVLGWPGGPALIVVTGLAVVGVGLGMMVKGAKGDIAEEIDLESMSHRGRLVALRLGQFGYAAKGAAFTVVGGLLVHLALTADQREQGLDGALKTILHQPYGRPLLTAVAAGFLAFGLYSMFQSRFRRM